ncbi:MAG: hypothetical protein KBF37_10490 [Saprospiraceae bacterium]|jgi:hypothetical protein|nr:hypothetical protein [Saprospiraceae bacterium]MBP9210735.1 hypothetical protein [Saprospiraceae bacterium]MBV6471814.1 hypothetical protein [Saprospiraceae bacterium]
MGTFLLTGIRAMTWLMSATSANEPADFMRQTGKIYVVYGVLSLIFIGIVTFLFLLERRISKLEKKTDHE